MRSDIRRLFNDDGGTTAVEYGLIAALVSIAGVFAFTSMGSSLETFFLFVSNTADSASN